MGLAPTAHVLFSQFMNTSAKHYDYPNRDRFVLSNGHACALQYTLLHLLGYDLSIDDLKSFRQIDSKTPGHPEKLHLGKQVGGVEVTTGPLGQGFTNAVGLAMAAEHSGATFNKDGHALFNNRTFVFAGDGCFMEGVSSEAASLAGHLQLGSLICLYDDNHISIDGSTAVAFTEDVEMRFKSYGWHTCHVDDGDNDLVGIYNAIQESINETSKPSLIRIRTTIGKGSKEEGTKGIHGSPLKADDLAHLKTSYGFKAEESFVVPKDVYDIYHAVSAKGDKLYEEWNKTVESFVKAYPKEGEDLKTRLADKLPEGWEKSLPQYKVGDKAIATRQASQKTLSALVNAIPGFVGGSADLTPSTLTRWDDAVDFQPPSTKLGNYAGRYFRFGVREHGMIGILNGLSAYGNGSLLIPYGATFLNFVSYGVGSLRLSALSGHRIIMVATHDSLGLGEDGPTHQPIEVAAHLRAIPNLHFWRPADGIETNAAYAFALGPVTARTPSVIALSRQALPILQESSFEKAQKGGYVVHDSGNGGRLDVALVSTGSEVSICLEAIKLLEKEGLKTRMISLPCWEVFDAQPEEYRLSVLPDGVPIMSVEVYSTLGWHRYAHETFGLDAFGASGPFQKVYEKFDFTPEGVAKRARQTLDFWKGRPVLSPQKRAFYDFKAEMSH